MTMRLRFIMENEFCERIVETMHFITKLLQNERAKYKCLDHQAKQLVPSFVRRTTSFTTTFLTLYFLM